jgi:F420-non-reducing hydrogenase iron-sulfur subunit
MVIEMKSKTTIQQPVAGNRLAKPNITVFHCFNAANDLSSLSQDATIDAVKMACSSMTREVFLLRAFESGADAVAVLVCPEGACHYMEGNIRARKRVEYVKKILEDIGIDSRRLSFFNVNQQNQPEIEAAIAKVISDLDSIEKE